MNNDVNKLLQSGSGAVPQRKSRFSPIKEGETIDLEIKSARCTFDNQLMNGSKIDFGAEVTFLPVPKVQVWLGLRRIGSNLTPEQRRLFTLNASERVHFMEGTPENAEQVEGSEIIDTNHRSWLCTPVKDENGEQVYKGEIPVYRRIIEPGSWEIFVERVNTLLGLYYPGGMELPAWINLDPNNEEHMQAFIESVNNYLKNLKSIYCTSNLQYEKLGYFHLSSISHILVNDLAEPFGVRIGHLNSEGEEILEKGKAINNFFDNILQNKKKVEDKVDVTEDDEVEDIAHKIIESDIVDKAPVDPNDSTPF